LTPAVSLFVVGLFALGLVRARREQVLDLERLVAVDLLKENLGFFNLKLE
jgi:uncharacterized membrane protein